MDLTPYDREKTARIPVKFLKIVCPHPKVPLYILVNKTLCNFKPSPLKAKFGQIEVTFGQVGQITLLTIFFVPF